MPRCPTCWRRLRHGATCPRDGAPPAKEQTISATTTAASPPTVDGYAIGALLGQGGFATVWAAERLSDGESVALKVARARTHEQEERLDREAQALSDVGPPACPALFGRGVDAGGRAFLAMEAIAGRSLADELASKARLEPPAAVLVASQLLTALDRVHRAGWIHTDIKAENALLAPDGLRLIDFGIARRVGEESGNERVVGSTETMAPEQLRGGPLSAAVDVYAAGVVLFELLSSRVPFVGNRAEVEHGHLAVRPPLVGSHVVVGDDLEAMCGDCLAKEPRDRPSVAQALDRLSRANVPDLGTPVETRASAPLLSRDLEPVVLLVVELDELSFDLAGPLERARAQIAEQRGQRVLCFLRPGGGGNPMERALDLATKLTDGHRHRVVIHVADLRVTRRRRRLAVRGDAITSPERWLPGPTSEPILLTDSAAAVLPQASEPCLEVPGFARPRRPADGAEGPLVGRDAVLARSLEALSETGQGPTLVTLWGPNGVGRSRLARELLAATERDAVHVAVASDGGHDLGRVVPGLAPLGERLREWARPARRLVVIDDIHRADDALLDAIEYAALDGPGVELAIAVTGTSELHARRPAWATRAHRPITIEVGPLDEAGSMELAAQLLRPADYIPKAFLRELAQHCGGIPASLRDVALAIKRDGNLVRRGVTSSFAVAPTALASLRKSPIDAWLLRRKLDALPPDFAAFARVVSTLGEAISGAAAATVLDAATAAGDPSSPVDPHVGLETLAQAGLLHSLGDRWWAFQKPTDRAILSGELEATHRAALARHAFNHWDAVLAAPLADPRHSDRAIEALANAAIGCGEVSRAIEALWALARRARGAHRHVETEKRCSELIACAGDGDHQTRSAAHTARGSARYRMHRTEDATADFERALELATSVADRVEIHLEAARALDWADRPGDAEAELSRATTLAAALQDAERRRLASRLDVAAGRGHFRRGEPAGAIVALARGTAAARAAGDNDTLVAGLLLLAPTLAFTGEHAEAESAFDEVIKLCKAEGDDFHLATAYSNRSYLWSAQQAIEPLLADLDRAIALARMVGQPMLERAASHNLAEFLHWSGETDRALALAERADELRSRFVGSEQVPDSLLLARIHASRGDGEASAAHAQRARDALADDEPPTHQILLQAVELWRRASGDDEWASVLEQAGEMPNEEAIELCHLMKKWAERHNLDEARQKAEAGAQARLADTPIWRKHWGR